MDNLMQINKEATRFFERQKEFNANMRQAVESLRSHALQVYSFSLRETTSRKENEKAMEREKQRILKNTSR